MRTKIKVEKISEKMHFPRLRREVIIMTDVQYRVTELSAGCYLTIGYVNHVPRSTKELKKLLVSMGYIQVGRASEYTVYYFSSRVVISRKNGTHSLEINRE